MNSVRARETTSSRRAVERYLSFIRRAQRKKRLVCALSLYVLSAQAVPMSPFRVTFRALVDVCCARE